MQDSKESNIWENAFMCCGIGTTNPTIMWCKTVWQLKHAFPAKIGKHSYIYLALWLEMKKVILNFSNRWSLGAKRIVPFRCFQNFTPRNCQLYVTRFYFSTQNTRQSKKSKLLELSGILTRF